MGLLRALPLLGGLMSAKINISNFLPSYEQLVSLQNEAKALEEVEGYRILPGWRAGEFGDVHFTYPGATRH